MTTEEKLKRFRELCIDDEKKRTSRIIEEYRAGLEASFEEHKKHALKRQTEEFAAEKEKLDRQIRSEIAQRQQQLKVKAGKRSEELKESLFSEVKDKLASFRSGPDYKVLIERELKAIEKTADGAAFKVFVDPGESEQIKAYAKSLLPENGELSEGDGGFLGGVMAIIESKNILIDNSFLTKLLKEKNEFSF